MNLKCFWGIEGCECWITPLDQPLAESATLVARALDSAPPWTEASQLDDAPHPEARGEDASSR